MEPQIQYATTSDGVSIAYAVFGEGSPLVYVAAGAGIHLYSQFSPARAGTDQLASAGFRVIRYDGRGTGSSDRAARDFSLEARLRDLEAVVDRLDLKRFALVGHLEGALAVVAYAARHSDRVSHLVLRDPYASTQDFDEFFPGRRALRALRPVAEDNWELVTLNIAHLGFGLTDSETGREYAAAIQSAMSPEVWVQLGEAADDIDVTELLGAIRAPTLIIFDTGLARGRSGDIRAAATKVAAAIPGARLQTTDDFAAAVADFVGESDKVSQHRSGERPSGTAIILFADIADSTALTERLGDAAFRDKARALDGALRAAITSNGGTAIEGKLLGDGVLATFGAAREAIAWAGACHRMAGSGVEGRGSRQDGEPLLLHIGIHAGDVIREEGNVFGGAVNIAARISGEAAAGETLVSGTVRDLARTSAGVSFEDRGERELKGVGEPVRVYAVKTEA